jgi:hypothetical protein
MKKILLLAAMTTSMLALPMLANTAFAEEVRDKGDLRAAHEKIQNALKDLERAQRANHYDMGGHAAKAEEDLRHAERELHEAIESREHDKR